MSGGFFALLDDIVAMAKLAAASIDDVGLAAGKASAKAAGVVIDDTAVTPRYVHGFSPERELPVIKKIAAGSLRNKLLFILPASLVLSQFLPWLLTPILMVGGTYLCYEGAEKVWEKFGGHGHDEPQPVVGGPDEKAMVAGAIRTDFILSAEIMVIALNEVAAEPLLSRAVTLIIVALAMTVLVYGVVAVIVKMDDVGLHLASEHSGAVAGLGRGLVAAMPKVLATLSNVGIVAMLWVGGHILLVGVNDLGWHPLYELVHHGEEAIAHAVPGFLGATLAWLLNTAASAVLGLIAGAIVLVVMQLVHRVRGGGHAEPDAHAEGPDAIAPDATAPEAAAPTVAGADAQLGAGVRANEGAQPDTGAHPDADPQLGADAQPMEDEDGVPSEASERSEERGQPE